MSSINDKHLTIENLLQTDKYIIPFYQRNYAWTDVEVMQLLEDIQGANKQGEQYYYLGTLVVAEIQKSNELFFEIVDGQQRHTTLSIIHSVLQRFGYFNNIKRNLYFDAREQNEQLLDKMFATIKDEKDIDTNGSVSFLNAMKTTEQFLNKLNEAERDEFQTAFYQQTAVFRVSLPEDTDLNHYFEIMNNRGEQLEKHEILKAAFMEKIKNTTQQLTFAKIWEACSVMNSYVQKNFNSDKKRVELFGKDYGEIPTLETLKKFDFNKKKEDVKDDSSDTINDSKDISKLQNIISNHTLSKSFNQEKEKQKEEKLSSVIDFPNFLLQVLKLTRREKETSLDDKNLLKNFGYPNELPNSMNFIYQLLNYRILFDKYVIKREVTDNLWNWNIRKIERKKSNTTVTISTINTFEKTINDQLIMLQSMFHVTFSSKINKRWLFQYLIIIQNNIENLSGEILFKKLKQYAVSEYHNIDKTDLFASGTRTPRFLFNYTDYLLWELYYEEVRGETKTFDDGTLKQKIDSLKDNFSKFKFVQRSSIEHFFPQSRIHELNDSHNMNKSDIMNCFGNLCLISRSSNSSLSNNLPFQKKNDSKGKNESLKQQIMFQYISNKDDWNTTEIENHQKEIIVLINSKTPNS